SEIKCRSRSQRRFHPYSAAVALDHLLAEGEAKSVSGVFLPVQALENLEYAALECRIDTRAVVFHGEYAIGVRRPGGDVDARRRRLAVFDGISDEMVQNLG